MSFRDSEGSAEKERFAALLQGAESQSARIVFWWRDDDAVTVTPQLDMLLSLARRHSLPLGLAVVPKDATAALAERLAGEPDIFVLQHGWQHRNHSPAGQKKVELGDQRPLAEVLSELGAGFERLTTLFPARFLPVLVPPWNRIGKAVNEARREVGLVGLSTFGPAADVPHCVNTHLDIFDWEGTRGPLPRARAYALLCSETERRLSGDREPIGLLTHHLIHQPESWDFLDDLLALTASHPAVEWRPPPELFQLSSP